VVAVGAISPPDGRNLESSIRNTSSDGRDQTRRLFPHHLVVRVIHRESPVSRESTTKGQRHGEWNPTSEIKRERGDSRSGRSELGRNSHGRRRSDCTRPTPRVDPPTPRFRRSARREGVGESAPIIPRDVLCIGVYATAVPFLVPICIYLVSRVTSIYVPPPEFPSFSLREPTSTCW
jgi:hypothetical protein